MPIQFQLGDQVAAIDEDIQGIVVGLGKSVTIETGEGFEMDFEAHELVAQPPQFGELASNTDDQMAQSKIWSKPTTKTVVKTSRKTLPIMEVDLHIEKLVKNTKTYSNFDMLNIQMDEAKRQLEWALNQRKQRIVFIHGVGEGVLKAELETLFRRYDGIKFYPADTRQYGMGAIEVYRLQNTN